MPGIVNSDQGAALYQEQVQSGRIGSDVWIEFVGLSCWAGQILLGRTVFNGFVVPLKQAVFNRALK